MRRLALPLLALLLLAPPAAFAGGPRLAMQCFDDPEIAVDEDLRLDGLVRARERPDGYVIAINPELMRISSLSPTTLEFLFQRECQLGALGYLARFDARKITLGMHQRADCQALRVLQERLYRKDYDGANRAVRTIERDLRSLRGDDWSESMGPRRSIDFRVCK